MKRMEIREIRREPREIKISASVWDAENLLPSIIRNFRAHFPNVTVSIIAGVEYLDLSTHDFDVALGLFMPKNSEIDQRFLTEKTVCFCASPKYLEENGQPQSIEEIKDRQIFVHKATPSLPPQISKNNTCALISNTFWPIVDAALNGDGLALLPHNILTYINKNGTKLVPVVPEFVAHRYGIFYLSRLNTDKREMVKYLFDLLKNHYDSIKP